MTTTAPARDAILDAVRRNRPPAVDLPDVPRTSDGSGITGGVGYAGDLGHLRQVDGFPAKGDPLSPYFQRHLTAMGGRSFAVADAAAAAAKVAELFPDAKVIVSVAAEVKGTRPVSAADDPHSLADVDVTVARSRLGVAEAGAVWLTGADLVVPALGVLCQDLVVLLDPAAIVPTLHDAYGDGRLHLGDDPYAVFMAGPSATGDIEGVIIHGAQGARTLTVLLLPPTPG